MRYLFFDIECSEGRSMCSFGYVLTDESFTILAKEDILMNPESFFHTGAWGKKNRELQPGIEMAYPKEAFLKQPTFPHFYAKIKKLIEFPGQKVIGFSHKNDTVFLDNACRRYNLPSIDYTFYDVQIIHKEFNKMRNPASTEALVKELGLDVGEYIPHKSDDDAAVSMLVTKSFCLREGVGLDALISAYPNAIGRHAAFNTVYLYKTRAESLIRVINRDSTSGNNTMRGNNFNKYKQFLDDLVVSPAAPNILGGKSISLSKDFVDTHFRETLILVQKIRDAGGRYSVKPTYSDYYMTFGNVDKSDEERGVANAVKKGRPITVLDYAGLLSLLGTTDKEIREIISAV